MLVLSVRQEVNIFWMMSAEVSTIDLLSSSPTTLRRPLVNSGLLFRIMTTFDRASDKDMLVLNIITPNVGLASAVAQDLKLISIERKSHMAFFHSRQ